MDTAKSYLDRLGGTDMGVFTVSLLNILKIPLFLFLLGNVLFSLLLFLRVRILADTFKAPENKIIQTVVLIYIFVTVMLTLLSVLLLILG